MHEHNANALLWKSEVKEKVVCTVLGIVFVR